MNSAERLAEALARARPEFAGDETRLRALAREAARGLRRWGHSDCDVQLEWVRRKPGAPDSLSCLFWCESCHVSQPLVLSEAGVR